LSVTPASLIKASTVEQLMPSMAGKYSGRGPGIMSSTEIIAGISIGIAQMLLCSCLKIGLEKSPSMYEKLLLRKHQIVSFESQW
jgi:hypothetical protein